MGKHQGVRAHLEDSSAQPEAARVRAATPAAARQPADYDGDGCRWLRDRKVGVQEAAREWGGRG